MVSIIKMRYVLTGDRISSVQSCLLAALIWYIINHLNYSLWRSSEFKRITNRCVNLNNSSWVLQTGVVAVCSPCARS